VLVPCLAAHSLGRAWPYRALAYAFPDSDGILFSEGDSWRRRHREFTPLFTGANVKRHSFLMFSAAVTVAHRNAVACALAPSDPTRTGPSSSHAIGDSTCYDLLSFVRAISMRVMLSWGLGIDSDTPAGEALADTLDAYARTALEILPSAPPPHVLLWGTMSCYASLFRLRRELREQVAQVVKERLFATGCTVNNQFTERALQRRKQCDSAPRDLGSESGTSSWAPRDAVSAAAGCPPNFITRMLAAGFTPGEMSSEVNHIHGAQKAAAFTVTCAAVELSIPGREGLRAALTAEFESVCGRPDTSRIKAAVLAAAAAGETTAGDATALAAIVQEFTDIAVLQSSGSGGGGWRIPTREDLEAGRLPLLGRVWRETLRRHVVSMGVMRRTGARDGGVDLAEGTSVLVLLHALHHDPEVWGDDAQVWDPDRWLRISGCGERSGVSSTSSGGSGCPLEAAAPVESSRGSPSSPLDSFFPFLDGTRRCAGIHLAELQFAILLYVLTVVFNVDVLVPPTRQGVSASASEPCRVHGIPPSHFASRDSALSFFGLAPRYAATDAHVVSPMPPRDSCVEAHVMTKKGGVLDPQLQTSPSLGRPLDERQPYALRKRDNMFAAIDGRVPFRISYR
jgi:cytochrome P450